MKPATLDAVDDVYVCSDNHHVLSRIVRHNLASAFVSCLCVLEKRIGAAAVDDNYLKTVLRPLRTFRYQITSLPLPFSSPQCIPANLQTTLQELVPKCRYIFPDYSADLEQTAEAARLLMNCTDTPLLDLVRDELEGNGGSGSRNGDGTAILLRRQPNAALASELRRRLGKPRIKIVGPFALLGTEVFQHLIAVGPLGWFPPHLQTAPRAPRLTAVHYEWLRDQQHPRPAFASSPHDFFKRPFPGREVGSGDSVTGGGVISLDDYAPTLDWQALHSGNSLVRDSSANEELASARLFALSDSMAAYLDTADGTRSQVIDMSGADKAIIRVHNEDLEPGMFILLRTEGGGDLVIRVADTFLAERAREVRGRQQQWKSELAALVSRNGESAVIGALQDLGCKRATAPNLHNWMSDKSIRPELADDFLSLLILCNLDSEFEMFFDNARLLDHVHRRAGRKIRQMLLNRISNENLDGLAAEGMMHFDLPGLGGGSFTAYRIEEVSPQTFPVPPACLNHPFKADAQWLG